MLVTCSWLSLPEKTDIIFLFKSIVSKYLQFPELLVTELEDFFVIFC